MAAPIENKAVAAPAATLVIGYLTGVLIEVVPWLKHNLTADQQETLPIILAFAASLIAAYFAPHTDRPDLPPVLAARRPYLTGTDPATAPAATAPAATAPAATAAETQETPYG